MRNSVHRQVEQLLPIVEGHDPDARRQAPARVDVIDARAHACQHHARVFAAAHEDDAFDRLRHPVELHLPRRSALPNCTRRKVADADRGFEADRAADAAGAGESRDDDVADVVERLHQSDAAHDELLFAAGHEAAADVGVAVAECLRELRESDVVEEQLLRIDEHLVLLDHAAEAIDVGDPRHALQALEDFPVLQALQVDDVERRDYRSRCGSA